MLQRLPGAKSKKATLVSQIMTTGVSSARLDTPINTLVHQMIEKNMQHIPVIDDERKVLGVVTQTDTLVALYKQIALSSV